MTTTPLPQSEDLIAFHDVCLDLTGWPRDVVPQFTEGVWHWIEVNHRFNSCIWEEEDQARRRDVPDGAIVANKRAIDGFNQKRNDAIERIDESLLAALAGVAHQVDARFNSETAGSMVDRLSIMALKMRAMRQQTERKDAANEHIESCRLKLMRLEEQRADLVRCLGELLADASVGRAYFKVYRQFKMYNDPTLNPYLYSSKRSRRA